MFRYEGRTTRPVPRTFSSSYLIQTLTNGFILLLPGQASLSTTEVAASGKKESSTNEKNTMTAKGKRGKYFWSLLLQDEYLRSTSSRTNHPRHHNDPSRAQGQDLGISGPLKFGLFDSSIQSIVPLSLLKTWNCQIVGKWHRWRARDKLCRWLYSRLLCFFLLSFLWKWLHGLEHVCDIHRLCDFGGIELWRAVSKFMRIELNVKIYLFIARSSDRTWKRGDCLGL